MDRRPALLRSLGLPDATLLVIGCIVGVGIFRTASAIAGEVTSPLLTLALWIFGGLLSLCGALCYAELAAMFPATGGDYVYISKIYGRFWGFLFGWAKLFIERTGTIAVLGVVFAEYVGRLIPCTPSMIRAMAAGAILLLTAVNIRGIRWGACIQNLFAVIKLMALAALVAAGLYCLMSGQAAQADWRMPALHASTLPSLGLALVFVLWTYGGWTEAAYVAEEIRHPTRNVPRALIGGVIACTALYALVNLSYLLSIPIAQLPHTPLVAAGVMGRLLGPPGAILIVGLIACSAFGALNGYILTGGRILYALGRDHALFARLGQVDAVLHTPALALWVNAVIAVLLVWTKTFEQIVTYSTVVISVFFTMAVFGVILLRRTTPRHRRPYRSWGYPVTPALFCVTMIGFVLDVCLKQPREAAFGFVLLLAGIPLYWASHTSRLKKA